MKNFLFEVGSFVSSFVPLYFLIIVKEILDIINGNLTFNVTNTIMICLNAILISVGVFSFVKNYFFSKFENAKIISIKNITTQNFWPYFPIFVLFALAFELEFINMAVVYIFILIMLASVYIKNDMFYINPFLNIIGFSTFEVIFEKNGKKITKKLFSLKKSIGESALVNNFFIKKEKDVLF
ncbi:MAG: hypothetical protein J5779_00700 [Clostridia bacterium]|nr:hypothetical protein [Clostridia bacterium]